MIVIIMSLCLICQLFNSCWSSVTNRAETAWEGYWPTPGGKIQEEMNTKPRNQPLFPPYIQKPLNPPPPSTFPMLPSLYLGWSHLCPAWGPGAPLHYRLHTETVSRPHNQMNDRTYFSTSQTQSSVNLLFTSVCLGFGMICSTFLRVR